MRRRKFNSKERLFVEQRALGFCEYCMSPQGFSPEIFSIEHITPLVLDGSNEMYNLALACGGCNNFKRHHIKWLDPNTRILVPLYNPRLEIWTKHFEWNDNFTIIKGVTSTGRATVDLLHLNRKGVVNLRRALISFGVHPPS